MLRFWRATVNTRNGLAFAIRSEQAIREELVALALSLPFAWLIGVTMMRRFELVAAVEELARETADGGPAVLIGTPWVEDGKLYNACALLDQGRIAALRFKANLPNYGVFDEKRLFARGPAAGPVTVREIGRAHV